MKKAVLKTSGIFTGKHLCWSLFLRNFIKKRLQQRCVPLNIPKFLRTPILESISKRLLLNNFSNVSLTLVPRIPPPPHLPPWEAPSVFCRSYVICYKKPLESCIKIKINLNFYFHFSLWCRQVPVSNLPRMVWLLIIIPEEIFFLNHEIPTSQTWTISCEVAMISSYLENSFSAWKI